MAVRLKVERPLAKRMVYCALFSTDNVKLPRWLIEHADASKSMASIELTPAQVLELDAMAEVIKPYRFKAQGRMEPGSR
jgi:hypothetical protein